MKLAEVDLKDTNKFSGLFVDYIDQRNDSLKEFYSQFPSIENFETQIKQKSFSPAKRMTLVKALELQYVDIPTTDKTKNNLKLLGEATTFTVTTGHQLNIFTGPLYFIYKIVTAIDTCKHLKAKYPNYNFVPVYWMASEDHDFDEINHFILEGEKYQWDTDQTGAVGRFNPKGLEKIAKAIPGMPDLFMEAYKNAKTLAEACLRYVNALFGEHGVVVVDADNANLKQLFSRVIEDDIFNHQAKKEVELSTGKIEQLGYKTQVYAREINFFYLKDNLRERIERTESGFQVLNTDIQFTEPEMIEEIASSPDRFSPNVILRPLYQETVLPNLAYIGGPSEVAYWFQLKGVFNHYETTFPILMPRNFAALLNKNTIRKVNKSGLDWVEFFKPTHILHKEETLRNSEEDILLNGKEVKIRELFTEIKKQAENIDKTLIAHVEAQSTITLNKLTAIEKKFIRAEKRKQVEKIRQIDDILGQLFPSSSLQERRENFISFYLHNPRLIDNLVDNFDPFNFKFYILNNG